MMLVVKEPMVLVLSMIDAVAISGISVLVDTVERLKGYKTKTFRSPRLDRRRDGTVVFFETRKRR